MTEGELLTPLTDDAFADDLSLTGLPDGRLVAAWKEASRAGERICWRLVKDGKLGPVHAAASQSGHPTRPCVSPGRLVWIVMSDVGGTLMEQSLDKDIVPTGEARVVAPLSGIDIGDFAVSSAPDEAWLLGQAWRQDGAGLVLAKGERWRRVGELRESFCSRPRICCGGNEIRCVWDSYANGCYRVSTALIGDDGLLDRRELDAGDDWETMPAIVRGGDGAWYLARCRERLVNLDGAVNHHSQLVVSREQDGVWRDVAAVDIDFAMNPWMAAYWGYRRFPMLLRDDAGAWLLWEEKCDPESMGPGPGRLCGLPLGDGREDETPRVLLEGHCMYVVAQAPGGELAVATKTQRRAYRMHVPWMLHRCRLDVNAPARPADLESNRDAPAFASVRHGPDSTAEGEELLLFGDPHLHSRYSRDLDGEIDELYHFARDKAGLDFVAFTENDGTRFTEPLPKSDWEEIRRAARTFNDAGRFTALLGWEYTLHRAPDRPESRNSHRSILLPGDDGEIVSWTDRTAPTPPDLVRRLRGERVLLHHHHATGFDLTDDDLERNIEICSGWGNWMRRPKFVAQLHDTLNRGFRMGLFGGSDNHERNPGLGGALTGLWAEANTREAVFEAFRQRRCFATTGLRPRLRFDVSGIFMGGDGTTDLPVVNVSVQCETPVARIEIVRDGEVVSARESNDTEFAWTWRDETCPPGNHFYYTHVRFRGETPDLPWNLAPPFGADAWTSPAWVTRP